MGRLANAHLALCHLEREVSEAAKAAKASNEARVYPWRPTSYPELPAIWNWIDDGAYEIVDTGRADDIVIFTATIGVKPRKEVGDSADQLVVLTDHFCDVVDPALNRRPVLPLPESSTPTAMSAKRLLIRSRIDEFNDVPVMCMDLLIRVQLPKIIGGL